MNRSSTHRIRIIAALMFVCASCTTEPRATSEEPTPTRDVDTSEPEDATSSEEDPRDASPPHDASEEVPDADSAEDASRGDTGNGSNSAGLHLPQWVLRDRSGAVVHAQVYPYYDYGRSTPGQLPAYGAQPDSGCFNVALYRGMAWGGPTLDLATGTPTLRCSGWLPEPTQFLDENCTQAVASSANVLRHEGTLKIIQGAADHVLTSRQAYYSATAGSCVRIVVPDGATVYLWDLEPLPSRYQDAFVSGAPYTLAVE